MNRILLTLSALAASLILAGCATDSKTSASSSAAPAKAAAAAPAMSDAAIAEKFKGEWTGEWNMPGIASGKFVFIGTSVEGTNVKGEAHWYSTAAGDLKLPLLKASVQNGVLKAEQAGETKFTLKMKGDTALVGDWDIKGYTGDLKVKR